MSRVLKIFSGTLILVFSPVIVLAYQNPGSPSGFVNDYADILTVEQKQNLESKLIDFRKETLNEIAVVTISDLGGDTIENYAEKLFKDWGIGQKGRDNGVLILISLDDKQMRIEVGYGLEGSLTDAQSFWIIKNVMRPAFRSSNYYNGLNNAVDNIISITKGEYIPDIKNDPSQTANSGNSFGGYIIVILWFSWVVITWLGSVLARSKSWWGGGVVGAVISLILWLVSALVIALVALVILVPLGLIFDYFISKRYSQIKDSNRRFPWWIGGGGRGFGGSGGPSGFSGGFSGGGGSSGDW